MLVDEVLIRVISGKGGKGCVSFKRAAFQPRGGPDGGNGGTGGGVFFQTDPNKTDLNFLSKRRVYKAQDGANGSSSQCTGRKGKDLVLQVPQGTVLHCSDNHQDKHIDLSSLKPGESFCVLKGGRGGKGNAHFKNPRLQAPKHAQPGEKAKSLELKLELKMIAHVGLIGLPNAGKSTLLSCLSKAQSPSGSWPFTTLSPVLGVLPLDYGESIVLADTPGLIKGAHKNVGLGHKFLRHIERTKLLLHMVDCAYFFEKNGIEKMWQNYLCVQKEIELYDQKHGERRLCSLDQVLVLSKSDLLSESNVLKVERVFKSRGAKLWGSLSSHSKNNIQKLQSFFKEHFIK